MALNKEIIITPLIQEVSTYQEYSFSDLNNLSGGYFPSSFVPYKDTVEFFAYDLNGRLVYQDYNFTDYQLPDTGLGVVASGSTNNESSQITLLPEQNTLRYVSTTGQYNIYYNFFRNILDSSYATTYVIQEISSDRTELRLRSNDIPTDSIIISANSYLEQLNSSSVVYDFYLNLGENNLLLCINLGTLNGDLLIKLYEPLPSDVDVATNCWFVEEVAQPIGYNINIVDQIIDNINLTTIQGPNYNIPIKDQINNSTGYVTYNSLNSSALSGSFQQVQSLFEEQGIEINVDYSNFENFINFSSAQSRLDNFIYKVQLIEDYSASLADTLNLSSTNSSISTTANYYQTLINNITSKFDGYEYYLYFESGSNTYPKVNNTPPYTLYSSSNALVTNWYVTQSISASAYDLDNQNWILNTIPSYLREDSANEPYETFLNMIGQYFDNIWVYTKDLTNRYNADNRLDFGISKDLVADALRSFGLKIYQNNYSVNDLYTAFVGTTASGSAFPLSNITSSLPVPADSGLEYITTPISASNEIVPLDDVNKRIYKRLYHNLPYLVKKKGTVAGLRALLNIYGVPDTILQINEFGGKDKDNSNDWDLWREEFNYKYSISQDSDYIDTPWEINSKWGSPQDRPSTLQFRFQTPNLNSGITVPEQVLWNLDNGNTAITLHYTGSGYTSGSYSGSIANPYNHFALLEFYPNIVSNPNDSASVYLPFFDGNWWSVMVTRDNDDFTLYAANNIYSGSDGSQIGFYSSASINSDSAAWENSSTSYFGASTSLTISGDTYVNFSGSYQEIRYFNSVLTPNNFEDYVMNPQSTEGNIVNGSYNQLAFRASLGGELYTGSTSIHPKVTGSYVTQSFDSDSNFTINNGSFEVNRNYVFYDSPAVGIKNRNNDKIKPVDIIFPSGNVLSSLSSLQQITPTTKNYTNNLNLLEVALSPQNEINDDIISQIGYFNIGDYIGDPRLISSSATSYPALDALRKEYFNKYTKNYDVYDYIRLIKFFDNSMFKMIKDFVPTRTGLASGIVVKPTILERQKYPVPQASWTQPEYTGSIGETPTLVDGQRQYIPSTDYESIPIETISGSNGGTLPTPTALITYNLAIGKFLTSNITQNSSDATTGGDFLVTNQNGDTVTLRTTISAGVVTAVEIRSSTSLNSGFTPGDIITIPTSNIGGTTNVLIQLTANLTNSGTLINPVTTYSQIYYGSNLTPYGYIPFTQSDAVEFVNGEFSGSILTITNGELNTECDPLKVASTTTIEYTASSYTTVGTPTTFRPFTYNQYAQSTGTLTNGTPSSGTTSQNDLNQSINFTNFNSGDIRIYWESTRTVSLNNPMYAFFPNTITDEYTPRAVRISKSSINGLDLTTYIPSLVKLVIPNYTATVGFTRENFSPGGGEGYYTVNATSIGGPGLELLITSISERSDSYVLLVEYLSGVKVRLYTEYDYALGSVITRPIVIADNDGIEVLFDPYVPQTFELSDCNVIYGNKLEPRLSDRFYDLDYSSNAIQAVNQQVVISASQQSGSATFAPVQDYNWYAHRSILPRYIGSRSTSNGFNLPTNEGGFGELPNVVQESLYFSYFNWVKGTSPLWGNELADRTNVNLRYFIDDQGTVIEPINDVDGINIGICQQNFEENSDATLSFSDPNAVTGTISNLIGTHTIFKSGKRIVPIIYTQTSSIGSAQGGGATGSINFVQGDQEQSGAAYDFRFYGTPSSDLNPYTGYDFDFDSIITQGNDLSYSLGVFTVDEDANGNDITINLKAYLYFTSLYPQYVTIELQWTKNGNYVGSPTVYNVGDPYVRSVVMTYTDANATTGDDYTLRVKSTNPSSPPTITVEQADSYFQITQDPLPSVGPCTRFWSKSGASIVALGNSGGANGLKTFYGQRQVDISGSGFIPITNDFTIQPYDEIRFQGTETQAYKVLNVNTTGGNVTLTVDRNVTATNLDYFLVRRYIDDPANIILAVDKPSTDTSEGILTPEYLYSVSKARTSNILKELKREQLI